MHANKQLGLGNLSFLGFTDYNRLFKETRTCQKYTGSVSKPLKNLQ